MNVFEFCSIFYLFKKDFNLGPPLNIAHIVAVLSISNRVVYMIHNTKYITDIVKFLSGAINRRA